MHEWKQRGDLPLKITRKEEAYKLLKKMGLSVIEMKTIRGVDTTQDKSSELEEYLNKYSPFLILATPNDNQHPKEGEFDIQTIEDFQRFVNKLKDINIYDLNLIQMVFGVPDGFVGTAVSSNLETFVEILVEEGITDVRKLTSGNADASKIANARFIGRILKSGNPKDYLKYLSKIRDLVGPRAGYYEFIKGEVRGVKNIWFVDYQADPIYKNIL